MFQQAMYNIPELFMLCTMFSCFNKICTTFLSCSCCVHCSHVSTRYVQHSWAAYIVYNVLMFQQGMYNIPELLMLCALITTFQPISKQYRCVWHSWVGSCCVQFYKGVHKLCVQWWKQLSNSTYLCSIFFLSSIMCNRKFQKLKNNFVCINLFNCWYIFVLFVISLLLLPSCKCGAF